MMIQLQHTSVASQRNSHHLHSTNLLGFMMSFIFDRRQWRKSVKLGISLELHLFGFQQEMLAVICVQLSANGDYRHPARLPPIPSNISGERSDAQQRVVINPDYVD